jgi:hypothetical protein
VLLGLHGARDGKQFLLKAGGFLVVLLSLADGGNQLDAFFVDELFGEWGPATASTSRAFCAPVSISAPSL